MSRRIFRMKNVDREIALRRYRVLASILRFCHGRLGELGNHLSNALRNTFQQIEETETALPIAEAPC